jgi:hypothetical protein
MFGEQAVADSRQGVVLQLGGLAWGWQLTVKYKLVTKDHKKQEDSWYSFLLEAKSTPGPYCGWKACSTVPEVDSVV